MRRHHCYVICPRHRRQERQRERRNTTPLASIYEDVRLPPELKISCIVVVLPFHAATYSYIVVVPQQLQILLTLNVLLISYKCDKIKLKQLTH